MANVKLHRPERSPTFRKMAMGSWKTAKDPSVYGMVEIDMTNVYSELKEFEKNNKVKVTPAHLVGKAICLCMQKRPEINGLIRGSQIWLRDHVALFYQVNIPGEGKNKVKKANLSGTVIHEAEKLDLLGIVKALENKSKSIKEGKDLAIKKNMDLFKYIPWCLTGAYLNLVSWLLYGLNLDLSFLGVPKDPFGSVMITNVGGLGIDMAYAPLVPYSRVPLVMTVGAVKDRPWVVDGEVKVRPILPVCVTFDHRLVDGVHVAEMAGEFKKYFDNPKKYLF